MKRAIGILIVLFLPLMSAQAQNWVDILQLHGTYGSSAFFFNAKEGFIGTGDYLGETPAQIYYTSDGGTTWTLAQFQNPNILGEVTDIYFRTRELGWATIRETTETGWSGVYRSTDGGMTWERILQAGFPVAIRQTSRGVFYTDRDLDPGVMFSSDSGMTWTHIVTTLETLGIDFMNDAIGFVSSQASSALCPHLLTTDSGHTWQSIATSAEAWTPYGDPLLGMFFLASERDQLTTTTQTSVFRVPVSTLTESRVRTYGDSGLTGGIAGSHICQSIVYVQGREPASSSPNGLIRTMNGGAIWKTVGGPNNINDKRFAVTGRGAVVYAFDNGGGVWRTTNGGDGTLSPSILPFVNIVQTDTASTSNCDSTIVPIVFQYDACDSAQIASVSFLNDSLHELRVLSEGVGTSFFSSKNSDTLSIVYRPQREEAWTALIRIGIRQPDGYTEDTTIALPMVAFPAPNGSLAFANARAGTIAFDSVSICSETDQKITISNAGCGNLGIDSMYVTNAAFSIVSSVRPFVLTIGDSRSFLLHFQPDTVGTNSAELYVQSSTGLDSIQLTTKTYSSGASVAIALPDSINSRECDSASFAITLQNLACAAFRIDSISINAPFHLISVPPTDSIVPGGTVSFALEFVPSETGLDSAIARVSLFYSGVGAYDTTFSIMGTGAIGIPKFSVSADSLSMGSVLICGDASDTLILRSSGCAPVQVSEMLDSSNGFSITRVPKSLFAADDSDTVIVHFEPGTTLGTESNALYFTTSAGIDTVYLSATVTASGGAIALGSTPNISALTCQTAPFSISLMNGLCDSITIESISISGVNAGDFSIADTLPRSLSPQESLTWNGLFFPSDSLERTATVQFTIQEADGAIRDTSIALIGEGLPVPSIEVTLGNTTFRAGVGQSVTIPIIANRGSVSALSVFHFALVMNSDLLTPASTDNGFFGNGSTITIKHDANRLGMDTVHFQFNRGSDALLPSGLLCNVECAPYVTNTFSTSIFLQSTGFTDENGSNLCLPSERVPDTLANFTFVPACGDTLISEFLGSGMLALTSIVPNPTTGLIHLAFSVPDGYANDGILELYNPLGEIVRTYPVEFPSSNAGQQTLDVDLSSGGRISNGILYARIVTPNGFNPPTMIVLEP